MSKRYVGIDIGAETLKVVELTRSGGTLQWTGRWVVEHQKNPDGKLLPILGGMDWESLTGGAVSGRLSRQLHLTRVPTKQAQSLGYNFLHSDDSATVVSIGSHGFSVLELRPTGVERFRENSRCSQGTGNFLRQLVERFNLSIEEASELCAPVSDPAPLSGRCPVILKTDMTHLANKGESRARILAGLYDAVCENVQVLIKPRVSPPKVVLIGGVARSTRIQENFREFLQRNDMALSPIEADDALFFEALGAAVQAAERPDQCLALPALEQLVVPADQGHLERVPPLSEYMDRVTRMPVPPAGEQDQNGALVLGFDIGSTGSKVVALDATTEELAWQGYINTNGNPVGAAQTLMRQFVDGPVGSRPVQALGATGSGREIVGSLMSTCYGVGTVFVLNEIAAHAEGAIRYDPRVDTIFEIGGQDAKYIRLDGGRVVDAAMNEACSAGTGSFIEEQGRKFAGIEDVVQLGQAALNAARGVSLGQHCSVFMAEIIDEAVAAGEDRDAIIAGIYDSIIQNYLNRVKGSRSVGQVIFCQGMPFSADALAAAVARQTGSEVIVPPNPGTVGALGIALLTIKDLGVADRGALDPQRFLDAAVTKKDTFTCKSVKGCGGAGNKCRIDRITTQVQGKRQRFTWGGGCSLYDKGTGKRKLPDLAPDPFREREQLVQQVVERVSGRGGRPVVSMTDEFFLKSLFPFFATFVRELGFDVDVHTGADQRALKRGIEEANVPFCAPMQQYHGLASTMIDAEPDYLFMPMLRGLPRVGDEKHAKVCPIVQASPDMLRLDLGLDKASSRTTLIDPVIDIGEENLGSDEFLQSCERVARKLGVTGDWRDAYRQALAVQTRFDVRCQEIGRRALAFCEERGVVPVVILGRVYTIYNTVLNSNVPAIVREQGAIPVPVDCYPLDDDVPVYQGIYWGFGQRNLRAAHQVRRRPGQYSLFCSNYSCGPDSFVIHFYSYLMEGKPFSVIETDGHSGDAGTKTRVEAFLHCVQEDLAAEQAPALEVAAEPGAPLTRMENPNSLTHIDLDQQSLQEAKRRRERVIIPPMGPGAAGLAACLRGIDVRAEVLPMPDRETVRVGRRHTSGKECVPMTITLGSVLQRLEQDRHTEELFCVAMPKSHGPCRFGTYNLLHKITLERLGWRDRVRVWSPEDTGYFDGIQPGWFLAAFAAFMAEDLLMEALHYVRPTERVKGQAEAVYDRYRRDLHQLLEQRASGNLTVGRAMKELATGSLFGCRRWLREALADLAAVSQDRLMPSVLVVGEIYVRCDPFANDFVIEKLEQRGIRCRFAPFNEWLEYTSWLNLETGAQKGFSSHLQDRIQQYVQESMYGEAARVFGWPRRTNVRDSVHAAKDYMRQDLHGEAVLTIGGPLHEHREGLIDGVVSVGPLECMPNKISEAQFFHAAEREGLLSLTLSLNGDPMDPEVLDNFAFEVHERFRQRQEAGEVHHSPQPSAQPRPWFPLPKWKGPIKTEVAPPPPRREEYPEVPLPGQTPPPVRRRPLP